MAKKRRLRATPDEVSEVRFYIPGSATGAKRRSEKAKKEEEGGDVKPKKEESDAEEEEEDDDDMGGNSAAQMFHDTVKEKAEVGLVVGEILGTVPDVLCLTPRGRFGQCAPRRWILLSGNRHRPARDVSASSRQDV